MLSKIAIATVLTLLGATTQGCQNRSDNLTESVAQSSGSVSARNPTIEHCQDLGYEVQPVVIDGVTQSHLCVNAQTGKKCDSWALYRKECSLDN